MGNYGIRLTASITAHQLYFIVNQLIPRLFYLEQVFTQVSTNFFCTIRAIVIKVRSKEATVRQLEISIAFWQSLLLWQGKSPDYHLKKQPKNRAFPESMNPFQ